MTWSCKEDTGESETGHQCEDSKMQIDQIYANVYWYKLKGTHISYWDKYITNNIGRKKIQQSEMKNQKLLEDNIKITPKSYS